MGQTPAVVPPAVDRTGLQRCRVLWTLPGISTLLLVSLCTVPFPGLLLDDWLEEGTSQKKISHRGPRGLQHSP